MSLIDKQIKITLKVYFKQKLYQSFYLLSKPLVNNLSETKSYIISTKR